MEDLQSILGYSKGSPYAGNPYLSINTPSGLIDMSNTPIDLIGIDETGKKMYMKAGRKSPYKFNSSQVLEVPLLPSSNKKQKGGNPYLQKGGMTTKQIFDFIFDDEDEVPKHMNLPTAPSTEEVVAASSEPIMDMDDQMDMAMDIVNSEFYQRRGNPYRQPVSPSGPVRPENVSDKAGEAYKFFVDKGYSPEIAAGIVGNIKHESDFNVSAVGDSGKARGLAQWHPDRYNRLKSQFDLSSFYGNLEAIDYELKTSESAALEKILKAKTPEQAAALVDKHFERSAGLSTKQRMNTAKNIHNIYGSSR